MHMKHVNKKYIDLTDGSVDEAGANSDPDKLGFAVISMLFEIDANVTGNAQVMLY